MSNIETSLRTKLRDPEYSEGYAESFLNSFIATQIKVIREQRALTQADLAASVGTTQAGVSRLENVNYSSWSIRTLTKIARAFSVRLKVSFEPYGTLPNEVISFDRKHLERVARKDDPGLAELLIVKKTKEEAVYGIAQQTEPSGVICISAGQNRKQASAYTANEQPLGGSTAIWK